MGFVESDIVCGIMICEELFSCGLGWGSISRLSEVGNSMFLIGNGSLDSVVIIDRIMVLG